LVVVVVHIEIFLGYLAYINCAYDLVCHFVQPNGYYQGSKTDTRLVLSTYADHIKVFYQNSFPLKRFFFLFVDSQFIGVLSTKLLGMHPVDLLLC
jgi:hypothetical protein